MALANMLNEIQGTVPGIDAAYAKTLINEAWEDVRRLGGWSFQLAQTGFTIPGTISTGTVTLQFGSATVIGDANASAEWAVTSQYGSLLTQRQFRSGGIQGAGTIYDLVAADFTNPNAAVLTLDRPFTDPLTSLYGPVVLQEYSIYQPYIVAPVADFSRWLSVLDVGNSGWLYTRADRRAIDKEDPQRQIFANPDRLAALGQDERQNSATAGWQRYELWPGPQNQFLYQAWYLRFGPDLVNLSDTLPIGIPESMVKAKARVQAYEQAEANKDSSNPRGAGADFRFLMGAAQKKYEVELKASRLRDRDKVDIFVSKLRRTNAGPAPVTFNSATGGILAQAGV